MTKLVMKNLSFHWAFVIPILLCVTLVALPDLDGIHEQTDENHSYRHVGLFDYRNSVFEIIESVATTSQQHVPLYYVLLGGWINLTGVSLFAMRTLSLLVGLLGVAVGYRFARDTLSPRMALWVTFMMATTAFFIHYNHEIRMYTVVFLFVVAVYWFYWRIISKKHVSWVSYVGLYASTVALIYTHYFGIIPLLSIGVYHVLTFSRHNKRWWYIAGLMVLAGLTFLPWLPIFIEGATDRKSIGDLDLSFIELLQVMIDVYTNNFVGFMIVYGIGLLALLWKSLKQRTYRFILCIALAPLIWVLLFDEVTTLIIERRMRYSLTLLPSFALLFGIGLDFIFRRIKLVVPIILIAWLVFGLNYINTEQLLIYANKAKQRYQEYPPIHEIMYALKQQHILPKPELLLTITPTRNFGSDVVDYYAQLMENEYIHIAGDLIKAGRESVDFTTIEFVKYDDDHFEERVNIGSYATFWLGYNPSIDPTTVWTYQHVLVKHHRPCVAHIENETMVLLYFVRNELPCELFNLDAMIVRQQENALLLSSYIDLSEDDLTVYSVLDVTTDQSDMLEVSMRIVDSNNNIVVEQVMDTPYTSINVGEVDLSDVAPGSYGVTLIYASDDIALGEIVVS